MAEKVRWGVIGSCGIARRRTIPEGLAAAGNAALAAVYDIDGEANAAVAERYGARACAALEALLAADLDAVYIATPVHCHLEQALACFRAGKHVLCEKPFSTGVREAERMVEAAEKAGRILGAGFMMRFQAQHREALRLVRERRIGRPVYARGQLSCWYPPLPGAWRQDPELGGGGSLVDMGAHLADLLEMFFGPAKTVSCLVNRTVHSYPVEDSAVAVLAFENGALGSIDAFFCIPDAASRNALELYGSEGAILASNTIGQGACGEMVLIAENAPEGYRALQNRALSEGISIDPPAVNTYRAEVEDFSRAVLEVGRPEAGAMQGLRSQKVLAACYESARTGRAVAV